MEEEEKETWKGEACVVEAKQKRDKKRRRGGREKYLFHFTQQLLILPLLFL